MVKLLEFGMNKLKILHISRPDNEGAGSFVFDIHNFINSQEEYDSKLITYYIKDKSKSNVISYKTEIGNNISILKRKVINKITKIMISLKLLRKGKIDSNYSPQSITQINNWEKGLKVLKKTKFKPDIILVYFIDNFLNIKELYNIYQATKAKFFFIMPDMALMTGGCHYAWDCEKYQNNCGNCPAIYSNTANDLSRKVYQYKKKIFNMFPFGVITGTEWLFEQAQHSSLLSNKKIKKILIPINENVFSPKDRKSCKEYFYLPVNKIIIFIGAQSLKNKRKGFNYLIDSLSILKKKYKVKDIDIFLLIACKNFEESIEIPFKYRYVGLLDLKKELLLAFNAADLFVLLLKTLVL